MTVLHHVLVPCKRTNCQEEQKRNDRFQDNIKKAARRTVSNKWIMFVWCSIGTTCAFPSNFSAGEIIANGFLPNFSGHHRATGRGRVRADGGCVEGGEDRL